jgi:serine/threonine protein kinase
MHVQECTWIQFSGILQATPIGRLTHFADRQLPMSMHCVSLLVGPQCTSLIWTYQYELLDNFGTAHLCSDMVPWDAEEIYELPRDTDEDHHFLEQTQLSFCHPTLQYNAYNQEPNCLPLLIENLVERGSLGSVYDVKIARHCSLDLEQASSRTLAVNQMWPSDQSELDLPMELICRLSIDPVLARLAEPLTVHTIYPPANYDLNRYMIERELTDLRLRDNLHAFSGIASALRDLHGLTKPSEASHNFFHLDIKPANILVSYTDDDRVQFRISDFSISHIKKAADRNATQSPLDIRTMGIDRPYLAPDVMAPEHNPCKHSVYAAAEVWSLGCIFSLFLAWLRGGRESLEAFESVRFEENLDQLSFRVNDGHVTVKSSIESWFKSSIPTSKSVDERRLLNKCWKLVESKMLICDPSLRASMSQVANGLSKILDAENRLDSNPGGEDFGSAETGGSSGLQNDWYPYATSPSGSERYHSTVSLRIPGSHEVQTDAQIDTGASVFARNEIVSASVNDALARS